MPAPSRVLVIGFDIRAAPNAPNGWDDDRRSRFLIREDVERPLSVDRSVWPAIDPGRNEDNPLFLWRSVHRILAEHPGLAAPTSGPAVIEIGALEDEQSGGYWQRVFHGYLRTEEDAVLVIKFSALGYDVADRYLLSGLSNCALPRDDLALLRQKWVGRISPSGLLQREEHAKEFKEVCDRLIPEHAPFCAYRIRKVTAVEDKPPAAEEDRRT